MVHIQSEILLSHKKKNEIMSLAATWVSLEIITTGSQKERQICDIIYRWNLKYDTNELIYKTETYSQTQKTNLQLPKKGFPGGSSSNESACNAGDLGLIPGLGRPPGEGNDYPLQYSCLQNSMNRGACRLQSMGSQRVTLRLCQTERLALSFHYERERGGGRINQEYGINITYTLLYIK